MIGNSDDISLTNEQKSKSKYNFSMRNTTIKLEIHLISDKTTIKINCAQDRNGKTKSSAQRKRKP